MRRHLFLLTVLLTGIGWLLSSNGWASEEALLRKLVEKRILTEKEAREIREEVAAEEAAPRPSGQVVVQPAPEPPVKKQEEQGIPEWVKTWKWAGDLRLRYELQRREPAVDRDRGRFRLRFGFLAKPWDLMEVGVRLATGASGNPVSTNQSFSNSFDKKEIFIDRAYVKYTPWNWMGLIGGKMDIPFNTTQTIWDSDVTPEGAAVQVKSPFASPIRPFASAGAFQVSELNSDAGDPAVFGLQLGSEVKLPWAGWSWTPSVGYYDFTSIQGTTVANVTNAPSGNTTVTEGAARKFQYDYDLLTLISRLSTPPLFGRPITLTAEWDHNGEASDNNGAWSTGLEVGKITEKLGSWKAFYLYRRLESDAAFGAITDSDWGEGGTNRKGQRMGLTVGLAKNLTADLTYTRTDEIDGAQAEVDTFQIDANLIY